MENLGILIQVVKALHLAKGKRSKNHYAFLWLRKAKLLEKKNFLCFKRKIFHGKANFKTSKLL